MLLNTDLLLEQPVEIRSEMLSGMFSVYAIAHRGDTWGGEFVTEIEARPLELEAAVEIPLPGGRNVARESGTIPLPAGRS